MRQLIDPPLWIEVHHLPENDEVNDEQGRGQPTITPSSDTEPISDDEEEDPHEHGFRSRLPNDGSYTVSRPPFIKKRLTQKTIDENILLSKRKAALAERGDSGLTQRTYSSSSGSRYSTDTTRTPSERAERLGKMKQRLSELSKLSKLARREECDDPKGHDDDDDLNKSPNQESACAYYDLDGVGLSQKKIIDSRIKSREKRVRDMNERLKILRLKVCGLQGSEEHKHL
jgi:hypothetical protein